MLRCKRKKNSPQRLYEVMNNGTAERKRAMLSSFYYCRHCYDFMGYMHKKPVTEGGGCG